MKAVVLIANSDPRRSVIGGVGVYAKNYLEYLTKNNTKVVFIGTKTEGKIIKHFENMEFIEATRKSNQSDLLFFVNLFVINNVLALSNDTVIHAQRPDWIIPFKNRKNKKLVTLHGSHAKNIFLKNGYFPGKLYSIIEWIGLSAADNIISVSEENISFYKTLYGKHIISKMTYIPPGIDLANYDNINRKKSRRKYGFKKEDKIVLYLGRFEKEKNPEMLLRAIKKANVKGFFVGSGKQEKYLKKITQELDIDIKFEKPVKNERVPEILACVDLLGLTSLHEGFPLVLIEAMAAGIPCISTDVGDVRKIIEDGVTGYIVDDKTIVEKLKLTLQNSPKFRWNCINKAKKFSWEIIGRVYT